MLTEMFFLFLLKYMDENDIPNRRGYRFTERVNLAISPETKRKLEALKGKRKDIPAFLRKIIDEALDKIAI